MARTYRDEQLIKSAMHKIAGDGNKIGVTPEELAALKSHVAGTNLGHETKMPQLQSAGAQTLGAGGAGALAGLAGGAMLGDAGGGAAAGAGAGMGGVGGYHAGNLLALLLKSKGYDAPYMTQALRGAGAAGGAVGLGGLGYMAARKGEKEGSYQPRMLLAGLSNAVEGAGRRAWQAALPESFQKRSR